MHKETPNCHAGTQVNLGVLVVNEERQIRDSLCRLLSIAGHICRSATNAGQAWTILQTTEIDVMILNVTKPDVSDLDFVARVKAAFPHCEVIMLTGVQVAQTAIEALSVGTSAFLIRPVGSQELLSHIERAAPRRNLQMDRDLYLQELEDRVRQQTCEVQDAHEETINRLMAAAKYRDEETGAHVRRVGLLSEALAAALGWPVNQTDLLRMAAPMHDIGKIGIPDAILQKSGKLSAQEFEIMKTHSLIGAGMLSGSKSPVMQMAEKVARAHHERWDGGGYPHGLRGEEIPECARIVAVVDVFDALTHDRVYRPAVCEQETLAMLERGRQTHFDSRCVSAFIEILPLVRRISLKTFDDLDGGPGVAKSAKFLSGVPHEPAMVKGTEALLTPTWRSASSNGEPPFPVGPLLQANVSSQRNASLVAPFPGRTSAAQRH